MPTPLRRVAIIEFGGHAEIQYSQLRFLVESGYETYLAVGPQSAEIAAGYPITYTLYPIPRVHGRKDALTEVRRLLRYLREQGIGTVVISSFSGEMVKLFMLFKPRRLRVFGIIHGTEKLTRSTWVRLLAGRVQGFFVLNDHLLAHCPPSIGRVRSLYTIFYPPYPGIGAGKEQGTFHVVVPGQLEYKRRNYLALLEELSEDLHPAIRIVLLGSSRHASGDGDDFRRRLPARLRDRVVLFDSFVAEPLFHSHIAAADLILPLLGGRERYYNEAISGSINLSLGYRIPMLVEDELMFIGDMQTAALSYAPGELASTLNALQQDGSQLAQRRAAMEAEPKFHFDHQKINYISYITDAS